MRFVIALALVVAACSNPEEPAVENPFGQTQYFVVETPAGPVPCISWSSIEKGGLSCDWSGR